MSEQQKTLLPGEKRKWEKSKALEHCFMAFPGYLEQVWETFDRGNSAKTDKDIAEYLNKMHFQDLYNVNLKGSDWKKFRAKHNMVGFTRNGKKEPEPQQRFFVENCRITFAGCCPNCGELLVKIFDTIKESGGKEK